MSSSASSRADSEVPVPGPVMTDVHVARDRLVSCDEALSEIPPDLELMSAHLDVVRVYVTLVQYHDLQGLAVEIRARLTKLVGENEELLSLPAGEPDEVEAEVADVKGKGKMTEQPPQAEKIPVEDPERIAELVAEMRELIAQAIEIIDTQGSPPAGNKSESDSDYWYY
ncbi:hypothetical protein HIM_09006 [Hirsutella minnesotensis 3608]|uniref:Uncharacterized protein n=1 Tax=Hirsutella minnesotensis 3608 TaxID=1043627 RepID=A0A0F7ZY01_9HYPO|nr:hypothetical protein HIM_09006 [Hirsutella minnesotensis 3608]